MKGLKVKVDMDVVNCVLLVVILALVVYCLVKQTERFDEHATAANNNNMGSNSIGNHLRKIHKDLHNEMNAVGEEESEEAGGQ